MTKAIMVEKIDKITREEMVKAIKKHNKERQLAHLKCAQRQLLVEK